MTLAQLRAEIKASVELEGAGKMGRKDLEQAVDDLRQQLSAGALPELKPPAGSAASPPEQPIQPVAQPGDQVAQKVEEAVAAGSHGGESTAPGAKGKEPWQMRKSDYVATASATRFGANKDLFSVSHPDTSREHDQMSIRVRLGQGEGHAKARAHEAYVRQAIERGDYVPPEVLADYPDLAEKTASVGQQTPNKANNLPVQSPPVTTPEGAGRSTPPPENTPERPGGLQLYRGGSKSGLWWATSERMAQAFAKGKPAASESVSFKRVADLTDTTAIAIVPLDTIASRIGATRDELNAALQKTPLGKELANENGARLHAVLEQPGVLDLLRTKGFDAVETREGLDGPDKNLQPTFLRVPFDQPAPAKSGGEGAAPAAEPTPSRLDRARDVVQRGRRSPHADEFGGVKGAKKAVEEEGRGAEPEKPEPAPSPTRADGRKHLHEIELTTPETESASLAATRGALTKAEEAEKQARTRAYAREQAIMEANAARIQAAVKAVPRAKGWEAAKSRAKSAEEEKIRREDDTWKALWDKQNDASKKRYALEDQVKKIEEEADAAKEQGKEAALDEYRKKLADYQWHELDNERRRLEDIREKAGTYNHHRHITDYPPEDPRVRVLRDEVESRLRSRPKTERTPIDPATGEDAGPTTPAGEFSAIGEAKPKEANYVKKVSPEALGADTTRLLEQSQKPAEFLAKPDPAVPHETQYRGHKSPIGEMTAAGMATLKKFVREVPEFGIDPTFTITDTDGNLGLRFKDGGTYSFPSPEAIGIKLIADADTKDLAGKRVRIDMAALEKHKPADGPLVARIAPDGAPVDPKATADAYDKVSRLPTAKSERDRFQAEESKRLMDSIQRSNTPKPESKSPSAPVDPVTGTINRLMAAKKPAPLSLRNLMAETGEARQAVVAKAAEMAAEGKITPEQMDPTLRASVAKYREGKPGAPPQAGGQEPGMGPPREAMGAAWGGSSVFHPLAGALTDTARATWAKISDMAGSGKDLLRALGNYTAPATTRADRATGEAIAHLGASNMVGKLRGRETSRFVKADAPTDTVSTAFAVMVEDQLRRLRDSFHDEANTALGKGETDKADEYRDKANAVVSLVGHRLIPDEAAYQAAIKNPDVREVIDRHISHAQPDAEALFKEAGGKPADLAGKDTGAFFTLQAVLDSKGNAIDAIAPGPGESSLRRPLLKKSPFARERTGTARAYSLDPDSIYGNIYERQQRIANQRTLVKLAGKKVGFVSDENKGPIEQAGKTYRPIQVQMKTIVVDGRPMPVNQYLYVPSGGIYREFANALNSREPFTIPALTPIFNAATALQTFGLGDATYHTALVGAGLQRALALKHSVLNNLMVGGLGRLGEAAFTATRNAIDRAAGSDSARATELGLAKIGALRPEMDHSLPEGANLLDKIKHYTTGQVKAASSKWLSWVDYGGRAGANAAFDSLVKQKLVKDTETNRRELINDMGQYVKQLQDRITRGVGESGIQKFIVATKTGLRMMAKELTLTPGVEATDTRSALVLRARLAAHLTAAAVQIGTLSYLLSGKVGGRPGTPFGSVDTGKDDKQGRPITIPLAHLMGLGPLMAVGKPLAEGIRSGMTRGQISKDVATAIGNKLVRTFVGVGPEAAFKAGSGVEPRLGPTIRTAPPIPPGKNPLPTQTAAAVAQINPTLTRTAAAAVGSDRLRELAGNEGKSTGSLQLGPFSTRPGQTPERAAKAATIRSMAELNTYSDALMHDLRRKFPLTPAMPQADQEKAAAQRLKALQDADSNLPEEMQGRLYNRRNARTLMRED